MKIFITKLYFRIDIYIYEKSNDLFVLNIKYYMLLAELYIKLNFFFEICCYSFFLF